MSTTDADSTLDLDPFAPIEAVPQLTQGSVGPAHSIYLADPEGEGGPREVGRVPAGQLAVSNRQLRTMAREIAGQTPWTWRPVNTFFDGTHFAYALSTMDLFSDVGGGDPVCLGLLFHNSYDSSWAPGCRLYAYRLLSATGLLHDGHFGYLELSYDLCDDEWPTEVRRTRKYLGAGEELLRQFVRRARALDEETLDATHLADLRRGPLASYSKYRWGHLLDKFLNSTRRTAWHFLTTGAGLVWTPEEPAPTWTDFRRNEELTAAVMGSTPIDESPLGAAGAS